MVDLSERTPRRGSDGATTVADNRDKSSPLKTAVVPPSRKIDNGSTNFHVRPHSDGLGGGSRIGTIVERRRNEAFLRGKHSHFCPPASPVPTPFGRRSDTSFPSGTIRNDPRTRNEVRTTGTRTGLAGALPSFGHPSPPFGPPPPNSVGRSDCVPVVPSNEDLVSFPLVLK